MKKKWKILLGILFLIGLFLVIYPHMEIQTEDKLIAFRYSDDISEFEDEVSLDECYSYYADRDITIVGFDFEKLLCFYVLLLDYEEGNLIETQYILEESYIQDFLENAIIEYNEQNIDVAKLIEGKKAIVSNTRYIPSDYDKTPSISYILHEQYEIMFIYEVDGLLVLQVGYPDEGPKYIAYQ